ncbi:TetR/AcrR family transcriptional regulator [Cupriavidus sp. TMH.W2]|uniref:TetR/AcrR family transcriptional regulator n=1 Tax=Cupriavidus sp. TMH.W2 TaxID=3434465 RepID=UPI003D78661F
MMNANPKRSRAKLLGRRPVIADFDAREHMLDLATQLFAERGIAATTVAQIAAAAGVSSAMVHYCFTTREKLLDAVVEERLAQAVAFVWDEGPGRLSKESDTFTLVQELVERLFEVTVHMPWLPSLWMREMANEGGLLRDRMIKRVPIEQIERFAADIARAQEAGKINPELEPMFLLNSILALVMFPLAAARIWHSGRGITTLDRDLLHRHVSAFLRSGISHPPRSSRTSLALAERTTMCFAR